MSAQVIVITGTDTGVGKTIVTAALAAAAGFRGRRVSMLKAAQTGVGPGQESDSDVVMRLARPKSATEGARYPLPLAPASAIRVGAQDPIPMTHVLDVVAALATDSDLVLVEGSGGLLVELDSDGTTIADVAAALAAPVIVVVRAGLGTLNHTALTLAEMRRRGLHCAGVVIGAWPCRPDIASASNLADLPSVIGEHLAGVLPADIHHMPTEAFAQLAVSCLAPRLGGIFDAADFQRGVHCREDGR